MEAFFFFIFFAIAIVILISVVFFSKKAIIKRKLKKSVLRKIADFKDGELARIVGTVEFVDAPLLSPLSNRKCSYYYVHIEQKVSSGKNSKWKTIIEEEISNKFLIREETSCAFINDSKIKSYIVQDESYSSGFFTDASENLENYLASKGYKSEGSWGFNKTLRYKEGILEEGEKIAVFGMGEWKDAAELNLPEKYGQVLAIKSSAEDSIYLSDDPDTTEKNTAKSISSENPITNEIRKKRRYRK
ncbi:hypothetical protein [Labilibaculum antarcticum]|uniref:RING-type E3 ubiquitin transferase n=1 Tax=Labilibaculum antarcticum TaxID=1717717 RepID=A0A1Y1CQC2_9BACT|nr:hypothetical protein [Labilibaculum antarcticum]BAX82142.1 hypothetical protein ALGA_3850 [Labilibaculum antarcticum]